MPLDADTVRALARTHLERELTEADAAGVAVLLQALRAGLAAFHRPELEPAIGSTPLPAPKEGR